MDELQEKAGAAQEKNATAERGDKGVTASRLTPELFAQLQVKAERALAKCAPGVGLTRCTGDGGASYDDTFAEISDVAMMPHARGRWVQAKMKALEMLGKHYAIIVERSIAYDAKDIAGMRALLAKELQRVGVKVLPASSEAA